VGRRTLFDLGFASLVDGTVPCNIATPTAFEELHRYTLSKGN
jgi:hypothetical protein